MSSSSEVRFEFPVVNAAPSSGPLERLWQSSPYGTMFLSGAEVHRREAEARSRGAQETESRLRSEHESALRFVRAEIAQVLAGFERQKRDYFRHMEREVVRLALAVARKAVGREMQANPAVMSKVVRDLLERLEGHGEITLRVAPNDVVAWREVFPAAVDPGVNILPDNTFPQGRCVMETAIGSTTLDAGLELDAIERELMTIAGPGEPSMDRGLVQ